MKDIRLLPGVLVYPDGTKIDCPITNVVLRDLEGFNYFKAFNSLNFLLMRLVIINNLFKFIKVQTLTYPHNCILLNYS